MNHVFYATWQALRIQCRNVSVTSKPSLILWSGPRIPFTQCHSVSRNDLTTYRLLNPLNGARRAFRASTALTSPRARRDRVSSADLGVNPTSNRKVRLSEGLIRKIFRGALSCEDGNDLLSKLQGNRENGTLDAPIDNYSIDVTNIGLSYLRAKYPLDEEAAIIARIDEEFEHDFRLPQTHPEYSRNQQSGLEKMRKENIKRNEREQAHENALEHEGRKGKMSKKMVRQEKGQGQNKDVSAGPLTFKHIMDPDRKPAEPPEWVKKYQTDATPADIPNLSIRERLLPGGLFTVAVVLLSLWFAETYTPPSREARLFPETPPAAATMQAILIINVATCLLWRVPHMWRLMNKYFVNLPLKPRAPQLLLSAFSHQTLSHLALNTTLMWFVGIHLHDSIGRGPFLALVFSSAVLSSYSTLIAHVAKNFLFSSSIGASGMVAALISAACVLYEGLPVKVPFLPQEWFTFINTGVLLAGLIISELYGLRHGVFSVAQFEKTGFTIDHVGHLTGFATGIAAAILVRQNNPRWRDIERRSILYSHPKVRDPKSHDSASLAVSSDTTTAR